MHLSDAALLAHLGISQWTARKLDRKASEEIAAVNNAVNAAGRYNKSLLPTCDLHEAIKTSTAAIRKKFYRNTLPWGIEGTFILPSANYLPFMPEWRAEKADWWGTVNKFLGIYPSAQQDAQRLLGGLYKASDYPTLAELKLKFRMKLDILPVPTAGDFRVELLDAESDKIRADLTQRVAECESAAIKDVWQRLFAKVEWLIGRLADPKNTFNTDTYEDARETCAMLTRLNFTNDPNLEAMRQEVEQKLVNHHPESLRNDPDLRRDVAAEAASISAKMSVFMEGLA